MNALKLTESIKNREISVAEVVNSCIQKIEEINPQINAFLTISKESALEKAAMVQAQIDNGESVSPLAGVPIALKDNISTKDIETSCSSKMLSGYSPIYNATVVDKLESAGMIVIGKTNMDEFAMGASAIGINDTVRNPWDLSRIAGDGSAAAIAAGTVPLTLATDAGGSLRQPCSFCGVTGIKPTYGAVSRYGAITAAPSLDQIGTIAGDINENVALLSIISGPDNMDGTCVMDKPFEFGTNAGERLDGIKIGLPRNYFDGEISNDVKNAVLAGVAEFEAAGASVTEFEMPLMEYILPAFYIISCAEASSNMAKFDGLRYGYRSENAKSLSEVYRLSRSEGFGLEVKRRIMSGSFVLSSGHYDAFYKKALQVRAQVKETYNKLFERFDFILSPISPATASKIGENIDEPLKMYMNDIYTASVNLAGLPAVAMPCGFDESGLPIGLQLIGNSFSEAKLITAGQVFQTRTDYHIARPTGGVA